MSPSDYHQEYQPRKSFNITRGWIWVKQIILQYDERKIPFISVMLKEAT